MMSAACAERRRWLGALDGKFVFESGRNTGPFFESHVEVVSEGHWKLFSPEYGKRLSDFARPRRRPPARASRHGE
jgi:hypothetical protein